MLVAVWKHRPGPGVMVPSDQGSQFTNDSESEPPQNSTGFTPPRAPVMQTPILDRLRFLRRTVGIETPVITAHLDHRDGHVPPQSIGAASPPASRVAGAP
ncbi:hypothetical protein C6Q19_05080 [Burkholderia cenocepacia]|nr:hypothetical protein A8F36_13690 [Burkholderia cenocepacia]PRF94245.1 hypothetical protein C6Q19_05080 [Burkholderia cenocepacia]